MNTSLPTAYQSAGSLRKLAGTLGLTWGNVRARLIAELGADGYARLAKANLRQAGAREVRRARTAAGVGLRGEAVL